MTNNFRGIYNAAKNIEPFEGVVTFEDVLEFGKELFNKSSYEQ